MTKFRNPTTLQNEVKGNSVYRKGHQIHVDTKQATCVMKSKSNGHSFS